MMGFFLLDNPPRSPQFYATRNGTPTWAVGVHTSQSVLDRIAPDTGAENVAGFISRRLDPASYPCIVDTDSTVMLVPDEYTTFSVATSGYNSRTWSIAFAARVEDLDPHDPATQAMMDRAGKAIAEMWTRQGVDIRSAAYWGGADALTRPCLFHHGDVQADRSDAWARHPERSALDAMLIAAILSTPTQEEDEDEMKSVILVDPRNGANYHCTGNTKVWLSKVEQVQLLTFFGVATINPAPVAWIDALATLPR